MLLLFLKVRMASRLVAAYLRCHLISSMFHCVHCWLGLGGSWGVEQSGGLNQLPTAQEDTNNLSRNLLLIRFGCGWGSLLLTYCGHEALSALPVHVDFVVFFEDNDEVF